MRRSYAAITVGALVVVVLAAGYIVVTKTREGLGGGKGYHVWALFTDAAGLYEKSRVQTAGIAIGQIERRELDPDTARAKITVRMDPKTVLWSNAVVSKKAASLLGELYLEIDPGTPFSPGKAGKPVANVQLQEGDQIKTVIEAAGVGTIIDQVGQTIPVLKQILTDVQKLTSGPITEAATNVSDLIQKNSAVLESVLGRVDRIAANVEGVTATEADDVKIAIKNVREITENIKNLVGASQGEVDKTGTAVRGTIDKLQTTVASLERSMNNIEKVTAQIAGGAGTVQTLINDDTIARNVGEITEDAGQFIKGVTKLQTIVGLRSEYNFLAGTFKNYVSVQLTPRPDKFYLFEIVDDPRGFREETTTLTESSKDGTVSEKQVKISEKLRFSLMFGKRVGNVTGRFGIKESTGGVGVDVSLLDDRLVLSSDVFDTRANVFPRVQARGSLAVWNRSLYLTLGIDDFLNGRARAGAGGGLDWFAGANLVFNDQDLKSLLLFGSGAIGSASGSGSGK